MKRIIFGFMLAMMCFALAQGKNRTVTENDSQGNKKRVIELRDTIIGGKTVTDTLSIMTYETPGKESTDIDRETTTYSSYGWGGLDLDGHTAETIIAVTAIVVIFGLPLFIIFTIFFFRYKNRKAKYRLAEQALASGQQLPADFFKEMSGKGDMRTKGISNICTGIGLFIFLWAITGRFGLGCIGLLVMFTGFGQVIIYYVQKKDKEGMEISLRKNETEEER